MQQHQRIALAKSLRQLDYPILAKHAMTTDVFIVKTYVKLATTQATRKNRPDILKNLFENHLDLI